MSRQARPTRHAPHMHDHARPHDSSAAMCASAVADHHERAIDVRRRMVRASGLMLRSTRDALTATPTPPRRQPAPARSRTASPTPGRRRVAGGRSRRASRAHREDRGQAPRSVLHPARSAPTEGMGASDASSLPARHGREDEAGDRIGRGVVSHALLLAGGPAVSAAPTAPARGPSPYGRAERAGQRGAYRHARRRSSRCHGPCPRA